MSVPADQMYMPLAAPLGANAFSWGAPSGPTMAASGIDTSTWATPFSPTGAQPMAGVQTPATGPGFGTTLMNNAGGIMNGIAALGAAYMGYKQLGLAKDSFNFQKTAFNTNLRNSIQSYNTALEDRIRGRTSAYEGKDADVQAYLSKHSLKGG